MHANKIMYTDVVLICHDCFMDNSQQHNTALHHPFDLLSTSLHLKQYTSVSFDVSNFNRIFLPLDNELLMSKFFKHLFKYIYMRYELFSFDFAGKEYYPHTNKWYTRPEGLACEEYDPDIKCDEYMFTHCKCDDSKKTPFWHEENFQVQY